MAKVSSIIVEIIREISFLIWTILQEKRERKKGKRETPRKGK
ncbi:MAG: hypothetical protein PF570_05590 [Candidatus Cloacimonetes bacterium]|jgi:hypothetical protein|nr:hypothetical protein [Candidatus Cloacimonadota bacterium]